MDTERDHVLVVGDMADGTAELLSLWGYNAFAASLKAQWVAILHKSEDEE